MVPRTLTAANSAKFVVKIDSGDLMSLLKADYQLLCSIETCISDSREYIDAIKASWL